MTLLCPAEVLQDATLATTAMANGYLNVANPRLGAAAPHEEAEVCGSQGRRFPSQLLWRSPYREAIQSADVPAFRQAHAEQVWRPHVDASMAMMIFRHMTQLRLTGTTNAPADWQ